MPFSSYPPARGYCNLFAIHPTVLNPLFAVQFSCPWQANSGPSLFIHIYAKGNSLRMLGGFLCFPPMSCTCLGVVRRNWRGRNIHPTIEAKLRLWRITVPRFSLPLPSSPFVLCPPDTGGPASPSRSVQRLKLRSLNSLPASKRLSTTTGQRCQCHRFNRMQPPTPQNEGTAYP